MPKSSKVQLSDLTLAPRRPKAGEKPVAGEDQAAVGDSAEVERAADQPDVRDRKPAEAPVARGQLATPPERRRQEAIGRAIDREEAASRLRNLKKAKARESKHFINIPLDWPIKKALEDAAHDHGLKMTVIVRDALEVYLKGAGYLK